MLLLFDEDVRAGCTTVAAITARISRPGRSGGKMVLARVAKEMPVTPAEVKPR